MRVISAVKAKTIGVYAADHVPKILSPTPIAIVTNLDTSNKPGSHWVAIYIDRNGYGVYFDSYGLAPISTHHLDRLRRNCVRFQWNKKKLQSFDSKVCGEYCIMFLHHMCNGGSLRTFCRIFSSNSKINDEIAAQFYKIIIRKLKDKKKLVRVGVFPRESSRGSGFCNQSCFAKL